MIRLTNTDKLTFQFIKISEDLIEKIHVEILMNFRNRQYRVVSQEEYFFCEGAQRQCSRVLLEGEQFIPSYRSTH